MFGLEPLTPAYGRTYSSLKSAQVDFDENKDFRTPRGSYCNKADLTRMGDYSEIRLRYGNNLSKTGMLKVK